MNRRPLATIALALALGTSPALFAAPAAAQPFGGGWGGMMGGYGPGYGMMYGPGYGRMFGPGFGPGCYGPAMMYGCGPGSGAGNVIPANLNLSVDDVKSYFTRWIAEQGNSHIKVGDVKEQGTDQIVADIVTQDNSLVQRFVVNRHTGFYRPSEN